MAKPPVRNKKAPSRRPWSKDDLRLLKGLAGKEPLATIAKTLKRTAGATRQKSYEHRSLAQNCAREGCGLIFPDPPSGGPKRGV
jgi:hypothetical protein